MARILLVEDDALQLEVRSRLLEAGGHEALAAFSPSEALRQAANAQLVVMDLRFVNAEGRSDPAEGLALIRQIRARGYRMPLIVLSGWPGDLDGHDESQMIAQVLSKPVSMATLLRAVSDALEGGNAAPVTAT